MQTQDIKAHAPTIEIRHEVMVPATELHTAISEARSQSPDRAQEKELLLISEPTVELHDEGQIRVDSSVEQSGFVASFAYELTAAFKAGSVRSSTSNHSETMVGNGNLLLQRLLLTSLPQIEIEVLINGGANQFRSLSIVGRALSTTSKEEAIFVARDVRRGIGMVLACEQNLAFTPCQQAITSSPSHGSLLQTPVVPRTVDFHVPSQSDLGFSPLNQKHATPGKAVRLSAPFALPKSFQSLAEAVILSTDPVAVKMRFHSVTLTNEDLTQIAGLLDWIHRNPGSLKTIMGPAYYTPAAAGHFESVLETWSKSPSGIKVTCSLVSETTPPSSLVQMLGSDLYGGPVEDSLTKPEKQSSADILDLSCCLPASKQFPAVFPRPELLVGAKIGRLFNRQVPRLSDDGVVLGRLAKSSGETVRLDERLRDLHLYLIGATGTGKSTLLFNLILQDIRNGEGVGFVDAHGDTVEEIIDAIPRSRAKDVVLVDPSNSKAVPGINLLDCQGPNRPLLINFAINELLMTFARLWDMRAVSGPSFEAYFRNGILLQLENDLRGATLIEFPLVFQDAEYRKFLKARCTNPLVVGFWNDQAEKSTGDYGINNMAPYIANKLNAAFIYNSAIRAIVGQEQSSIDFRQIMDKRGILLIKVAKGSLGALDAQFLGSIILAKLFSAALGRTNQAINRRTPFTLYVDEFQNFANNTVCDMMAESRKFGLRLVLANQTLSQLSEAPGRPNVAAAVLGNAGGVICYRVGPEDAKILQRYSAPDFSAEDLQALPNYHAMGRLLTAEGPTCPFVFQTFPKSNIDDYPRAKRITLMQRQRLYTRPAREVEKEIRARRYAYKSPEMLKK